MRFAFVSLLLRFPQRLDEVKSVCVCVYKCACVCSTINSAANALQLCDNLAAATFKNCSRPSQSPLPSSRCVCVSVCECVDSCRCTLRCQHQLLLRFACVFAATNKQTETTATTTNTPAAVCCWFFFFSPANLKNCKRSKRREEEEKEEDRQHRQKLCKFKVQMRSPSSMTAMNS